MKKAIVTVQFMVDVDDHTDPSNICLQINDKDIKVVDFDRRGSKIGVVKNHCTIDIEEQ